MHPRGRPPTSPEAGYRSETPLWPASREAGLNESHPTTLNSDSWALQPPSSYPTLPCAKNSPSLPGLMRRLVLTLAFVAAASLSAHPDIDEALARLNDLIAASPDKAAYYFERGQLYARHDDTVSADANYLRAAELAPQLPGLAKALGALALVTGELAEARKFLDAALKEDSRDAEALVLRGRTMAGLKLRAAALADFNAALALLDQPPPDIYLARAALMSDPTEAIRSLDEGLERIGAVPSLLLRALALEESSGRIDAAARRINQIIALTERGEGWLKRRGDLFNRAGRAAEAKSSYSAALAAVAALPAWLRDSPEKVALAGELKKLISPLP